MPATDSLGSHLLGRKPSPPDARDYKLVDYLGAAGNPVEGQDPLVALLATLVDHGRYWDNHALKNWATAITARVIGAAPAPDPSPTPPTPPSPQPTPTPAPVATDVMWLDTDNVLDQGQTPHCVGFGWAGWGDTLPIDDKYANADGDAIYYEAKVIDGEPNQEDGSDVRSGAKAMQNRKRLTAYAFAASIDEVRAWLDGHGPVVFGTEWTQAMFTPDANGYVSPADAVADPSQVAGGHCFVCVGDLASEGALLFQNSWGQSWGLSGRFKMTYASAAVLLAGIVSSDGPGEACAAVELPE